MLQNSRKAEIWRYLVPLQASVQTMIEKAEAIGNLYKESLK